MNNTSIKIRTYQIEEFVKTKSSGAIGEGDVYEWIPILERLDQRARHLSYRDASCVAQKLTPKSRTHSGYRIAEYYDGNLVDATSV